uniref:Uncharacterized protein n=1 Tax=Anguilla anguilla TaxID=7936 RepID=A0A0E9UBN4_ANGAN
MVNMTIQKLSYYSFTSRYLIDVHFSLFSWKRT